MFVKKDSKGITLIALVITIIVLLILAGITIAFLTGENSIFGKATNAKIENEKAEIKEMLSLSVNTISVERGQKQDSLSNYYNEKETFIEKGKLDTTKYKINNYEYNEENKIVTITIYKENGTQNQYEYEINLGTGGIEFKNRGEIVDPNKANKISYETNGGSFAEGTDVVTEYKKGDIVGFISPVKEGAAFDGWYLNNNFDGESITKITKDMDGDITVYAKWLVETDPSYFEYSTIDGQDALIGFSDIGKKAYNEGQEEAINLVIPKKNSNGRNIVIIGQSAFKNCNKIEKLIIPNEVTVLKEYSFASCTGLKELTIPITIDASYFKGDFSCNFEGCTELNVIKFTKGNTGIGYDYSNYYYTPWYMSRQNELKIELEEGIESVGKNMFRECTGIKTVSIPTTLKKLRDYAFSNCSKWNTQLDVTKFTDVGAYAFNECAGITGTIEISSQIKDGVIPVGMFYNCVGIEKLIIPNEVNNIKEYSFGYCTGLKELTIPITIDASYANGSYSCNFEGCTGLNIIKFTKGTTGIGYDYSNYYYTPWYKSNNNKKIIIIDKEIISIGKNIFNGLNNVAYYYIGSQEEWANVSVDSSNAITIEQYNYKE